MDMLKNINENLIHLENSFNVKYPIIKNATYKSLVNYASDLDKKIQRWYRYKEGYSVTLIDNILDFYKVSKNDIIIDPFVGSGSTIIEAKRRGCFSIGYEVNPFSYFLCKVKTQNYSEKDSSDFKNIRDEIINNFSKYNKSKNPKISTLLKLFDNKVLTYLLKTKRLINDFESSKKSKELAKLAWLSILEESSNYRKAGNGLKIKKTKKKEANILQEVKDLFKLKLDRILEDLEYAIRISRQVKKQPLIIKSSSLRMKNIEDKVIKGVIFSPPYANCFDYTEIYKIELWLGDFVSEYSDFKKLRKLAVQSHLNGYKAAVGGATKSLSTLDNILVELSQKKLWDNRIPEMIRAYFYDMFSSLDEIFRVLKTTGFCSIIVSSSAYAGVIIPTDLLFAEYAKKLGFKVREIDVARFIIPSSQQYTKTKKYKKFLRESIIYLEK